MATDWLPIAAAATGGMLALTGSYLTDFRRDRRQYDRNRQQDRWETYVEFTKALDAAHAALRGVAQPGGSVPDRGVALGEAMVDAGIYRARERLLMSGTVAAAGAGERAFLALVAIRDVVRAGGTRASTEYHEAYHVFAEALWAFRGTVRAELGEAALTPGELGKRDWSEREGCPRCGRTDPATPVT